MNKSTLKLDKIHSDNFHISETAPKVVITGPNGEDHTFTDRIQIFRDGNDRNHAGDNCITSRWFANNYDFEAYVDDYFLIHRMKEEVDHLKRRLHAALKKEGSAAKRFG